MELKKIQERLEHGTHGMAFTSLRWSRRGCGGLGTFLQLDVKQARHYFASPSFCPELSIDD